MKFVRVVEAYEKIEATTKWLEMTGAVAATFRSWA